MAKCCPELVHINFSGNKLANESIRTLAQVQPLKNLVLSNNGSIEGLVLRQFRNSPDIASISLHGTTVTKESYKILKVFIPSKCKVI